jgi:outer membrane protein assembly factor BamB
VTKSALSIAAVLALAPLLPAGDRWPQFRGPKSAGVAEGPGLPESWSATENVVFRAGVPGRGWSSPVIWGTRVFLTTAINEAQDAEPKRGLYLGGEQARPPESVHRWVVLCLDAASGKPLWERTSHAGRPQATRHVKNTFASETPVADAEGIYALFGGVGLFAYDHEGKPLWSHPLQVRRTRYGWGTAASPAIHGDRIFLVDDNEERSYLLALDRKTGEEVWRRDRDEKTNWSTPFVWANGARTEIVTTGSRAVRSYDLEGKPLWELTGMSSITIPTPVEAGELLLVGSGFVMDDQRPLYAVRPGGSGDLTLKKGETSSEMVAWSQPKGASYHPSPLAYGDLVYVLYDRGFLAAYDKKTGREVYARTRLDEAANAFTASPWAFQGRVFCLSEDGDAFVVEAGPQFKVVRKNRLEEMCMATPAIAGKSLYVRTLTRLYRIEDKGGK